MSWVYDKTFDERAVKQGHLSLSASKSHAINRTHNLTYAGSLSYIDSDPEEYNHLRANVTVSSQISVKENLNIIAFLSGTYIDYEDYFPALFTTDRKDYSASTGVSFLYNINDHISLSASVSANYNDSTIDLFDYSSISGDSKLGLKVKF